MVLPIAVIFHQRSRDALLENSVRQVELKGFLHLIGLIFVATNCRDIVDNCLKYGWVVRLVTLGDHRIADHPGFLIGCASVVLLALLGYLLEYKRGHNFAAAWAHVIQQMQTLELQLQAARTTHNIYKLQPEPRKKNSPPPSPLEATCRRRRSTKSPDDPPKDSLAASQDPQPKEIAEPDEDYDEDFGDDDDEDDEDEDEDTEPADQSSQASSDDALRPPLSPDLGNLYNHARQRYIDATKKIDLSKILSAAEGYMRTQGEKIKNIKEEINDLMTPLVTVYNNLSLRITEHHIELVHCTYLTAVCALILLIPYLAIISSSFDPLSSLALLMLSCTWFLKMISFFHTLHCLRRVIISDIKSLRNIVPFDDERASYLHYPHSLKFDHFLTYLLAPTLCFQFNYPRSKRRDWWKIGKTFCQLLFSLVLLKIIFEQYVTKILENTEMSPSRADSIWLVRLLERLLKLSIPTLYCWLLMFISFFHYYLILLAELTRFEDKEFYKDWWNATSFSDYWRRWNLPVHNFCRRHVYFVLLSYGFSKNISSQVVFLLSAIAHEYIIAGSLKLGWTGLVFLSFVVQTPLSILTESKFIRSKPILGNSIFWIVFSFTGQPMGVLIFYYLWNLKAPLPLSG